MRCMPYTEDTLMQHNLRAFQQITIRKYVHIFHQNIPDSTEYGPHVTNNRLLPTMMLKSANPTVVTISPPSANV